MPMRIRPWRLGSRVPSMYSPVNPMMPDPTSRLVFLCVAMSAFQFFHRSVRSKKGDRVVAILPNTPHSLVAFCATASVGAIWSLCAPDMGETAVLDRFKQIDPKVLICQDSYTYAGKFINKVNSLKDIIKNFKDEIKKFVQVCPKEMINKLKNPITLKSKIKEVS